MTDTREADRREIIELTYRYGRAMDDRDWTEFGSLFTADAEANYADNDLPHGREEIVGMVRTVIETCAVTHHTMTNHLVEFDGDEASVELYCRAFHLGSGQHDQEVFDVLARYRGRVRRTPDGWQIANWRETLSHAWGSQEIFTP